MVVVPANATLWRFDNVVPAAENGMHFCLYNNLWYVLCVVLCAHATCQIDTLKNVWLPVAHTAHVALVHLQV